MATVPVKNKRTIYSLSVKEQYPRFTKFMQEAPAGHRSAQICQMCEEYLEWEETGQVSMLAILARMRGVMSRLEQVGPGELVAHSSTENVVVLAPDVLDNLVSLGVGE